MENWTTRMQFRKNIIILHVRLRKLSTAKTPLSFHESRENTTVKIQLRLPDLHPIITVVFDSTYNVQQVRWYWSRQKRAERLKEKRRWMDAFVFVRVMKVTGTRSCPRNGLTWAVFGVGLKTNCTQSSVEINCVCMYVVYCQCKKKLINNFWCLCLLSYTYQFCTRKRTNNTLHHT